MRCDPGSARAVRVTAVRVLAEATDCWTGGAALGGNC